MPDALGGAEAVRRLLEHPEYELVPLKNAVAQSDFLPKAATVTVIASPTKPLEATLDLAGELAGRGFTAIPHLAARMVEDRAHLTRIAAFLDDNNLRRVFIVAGDAKEAGEFPHSLSLIRGLESLGATPPVFGIASYPDGHPFIDGDALAQSLSDKQPYASYMTTQMCFDADTVADWVSAARSDGVTLPIHLGIPGVAAIQKLIRISVQIGVGQSAKYLSRHKGLFRRITPQSTYSPDELIADLIGVITDPAARVEALHFYTFNEIEALEVWRQDWLRVLEG